MKGYVVELPFDEEVGIPIFVVIIPDKFEKEIDRQHALDVVKKSKIHVVKNKLPDEEDWEFSLRLDTVMEKVKKHIKAKSQRS